MNKYEVIGMFTAMDELLEAKAYSGLSKVIKETLAAAKGEKYTAKKESEENEKE